MREKSLLRERKRIMAKRGVTWQEAGEFQSQRRHRMGGYKMIFANMDELRKRFKKEGSSFQRGYFDAYNNPKRTRENMPKMTEVINQLLIKGELTKSTSEFFEGIKKGATDRNNENGGKMKHQIKHIRKINGKLYFAGKRLPKWLPNNPKFAIEQYNARLSLARTGNKAIRNNSQELFGMDWKKAKYLI